MRLLYAATSSCLTAAPPTQSTQPSYVSSGNVPNESSRTPPRTLTPSRDALFALSAALDEADQLLFRIFEFGGGILNDRRGKEDLRRWLKKVEGKAYSRS
jgi:hypothetical protein